MNTKKGMLAVLILIASPLIYAAYIYPALPKRIPIHFNWKGEADGWGGPDSIFIAPGILGAVSLLVYFLLTNLKSIDPLRYQKANDGIFHAFAFAMVVFITGLNTIIIYSSTHTEVPVTKWIIGLVGMGMGMIGLFMPKLKQNYFAGFRLPWTLSSEANWDATHKIAGKWWFIGGMLQMLSGIIFDGKVSLILFLSLMACMVAIPVIYSYRFFKKETSNFSGK
jgi:uncharacterized membrane protein